VAQLLCYYIYGVKIKIILIIWIWWINLLNEIIEFVLSNFNWKKKEIIKTLILGWRNHLNKGWRKKPDWMEYLVLVVILVEAWSEEIIWVNTDKTYNPDRGVSQGFKEGKKYTSPTIVGLRKKKRSPRRSDLRKREKIYGLLMTCPFRIYWVHIFLANLLVLSSFFRGALF
jgi:hypothetical protein